MDSLWSDIGGYVVHPRATMDRLAQGGSIRPAVLLAGTSLLIGWANMALFGLAGYDWLGTRGDLLNPTYVGFFGRLRVDLQHWVTIFSLLNPPLALLGLAVVPGLAHLLSKLWQGVGTFEQSVVTLVYALIVPDLVIRATSEVLFGVPINLLSGDPYWWTSAMQGGQGPLVAALWNGFVIGGYAIAHDLWIVGLGATAIRRVQRVPVLPAVAIMLLAYMVWMYGIVASFVR